MNTLLLVGIAIAAILVIVWMKKQRVKRITAVLFYAEWCPACQAVKPEWDKVKAEMGDKFDFEEVNIDNATATAAKEKEVGEKVPSVPTIFVIKGMEISKYEGPRNREKFIEFLESR